MIPILANPTGVRKRNSWYGIPMMLLGLGILLTPSIVLSHPQAPDPQTDLVSIDIQLDKQQALVAERIQLTVTATAPEGVTITYSDAPEQLGDLDVVLVKDIMDIPDGDQRRWVRQVGLECLVSGDVTIPPMEIGFIDRRVTPAVSGVQTTPAQSINIGTTLEGIEDPTQFRDIKSVAFALENVKSPRRWLVWAISATGLTALLALALVLVRRKSSISPKQWAIHSLIELRDSQAEFSAEQVYVRLVEVLRTFVFRQFEITAPRLTTPEFLDAMKSDERLSSEFRDELQELLKLADMIKFAGMSTKGHGLTDEIENVIQLVQQTSDSEPQRTAERNSLSGIADRQRQFPHEGGKN